MLYFVDIVPDKTPGLLVTESTRPQQILGQFNFSKSNMEKKQAERERLKQNLLDQLARFHTQHKTVPNSPITNLDLETQELEDLNAAIAALEAVTPYPEPLRQGIQLLNANWLLRYSDAREITSLSSRTQFGLQLGAVYQNINVDALSFENRAYVQHQWSCIAGSVAVTARFEPAPQPGAAQNRRINVFFEKRSLSISKLLGLKTPFLDPFKVILVTPPKDRTPCLDITYLDEDLRIGRGGDGSLFVLTKSQAVISQVAKSSLTPHRQQD